MYGNMAMTYSIAVRTLGTGGVVFRKELCSIAVQTIPPERVLIYIAEGYPRPEWTVGKEEYRWVTKGMMAQRILPYDEIESDCILMLDDDVCLAPDSAERMLRALEENGADCVGADVFRNQDMPLRRKLYAAVTNLVFPHWDGKCAFRLHANGSFSYNARPVKDFYWSQTCGGPAALWRKEAFLRLHLEDELWLDRFPFAYNEDTLSSYKLYRNGGRLGVLYRSGIENLDARTASEGFRKSAERVFYRTKASFMVWWRICFRNGADTAATRFRAAGAFGIKCLWLSLIMAAASLLMRDAVVFSSYFRGLREGWKAVHGPSYRALPPYVK